MPANALDMFRPFFAAMTLTVMDMQAIGIDAESGAEKVLTKAAKERKIGIGEVESMEQQMLDLALAGLLSRFVGMLTDSRSFLSYTRHEYFRRVLCNMLGRDIERGLIPNDMKLVSRMVRDISYNNAARYFGFNVPVLD